jgi:hypothetical protein
MHWKRTITRSEDMTKSRDKTAKTEPVELDEKALGEVAGGSDPAGRTYYVGTANGGVWKTTDGSTEGTPDVIVAAGPGAGPHIK